jgi:hypothetical protein
MIALNLSASRWLSAGSVVRFCAMRVRAVALGLAVVLVAWGCGSDGDGDGGGSGAASGDQTGGSTGSGSGGTGTGSPGGAGGASDCCGYDVACPSGTSCQGTRDDFVANTGACEPTPTDGGCWNTTDCPADGLCTGVRPCGCTSSCDTPPTPGTCDPMGEPCCLTDADCGQRICIGAGGFDKGRCVDAPSDGTCYTDDDCAGGDCVGAEVCPCGTNCPTLPGTCTTGS